jgi:hypothetical protein
MNLLLSTVYIPVLEFIIAAMSRKSALPWPCGPPCNIAVCNAGEDVLKVIGNDDMWKAVKATVAQFCTGPALACSSTLLLEDATEAVCACLSMQPSSLLYQASCGSVGARRLHTLPSGPHLLPKKAEAVQTDLAGRPAASPFRS